MCLARRELHRTRSPSPRLACCSTDMYIVVFKCYKWLRALLRVLPVQLMTSSSQIPSGFEVLRAGSHVGWRELLRHQRSAAWVSLILLVMCKNPGSPASKIAMGDTKNPPSSHIFLVGSFLFLSYPCPRLCYQRAQTHLILSRHFFSISSQSLPLICLSTRGG